MIIMIVALINIILNVLEALINIMPQMGFFEGLMNGFNAITSVFYELSPLIPFSALFTCINIISGFYVTLFAINSIKFIIHRVPFIN